MAESEPKVIPTFYPMSIVGKRATRKCLACVLARPSCFKAGENPVLGVRTKGRFVRSNRVEVPLGSFNQAGVGSFRMATCGIESMIRLGVRAKCPAMNSSTMRGAEALAGEWQRRRCRNAKGDCRRVGEVLLPSAPRNQVGDLETLPGREPGANDNHSPGNTG